MDMLRWLVPWEESPTFMLVMGTAAILFAIGSGQGRASAVQKLYFWIGWGSLYIVSQTQLEYYSEHAFFLHRLQHVVLHHFGPFFVALSRPGTALFAGLPGAGRSWLRQLSQFPTVRWLLLLVRNPAITAGLFVGVILFWLIPSIHFPAMLDWRLYRVMNWSVTLTGLMFWSQVLSSGPHHLVRLSLGHRITMMLAVIPPQIAIGALLFFAPQDLYSVYTICGRAFADLDPVADQQIGGLLLWIPPSMMSVFGVLIVMRESMRQLKLTSPE